PIRVPVARPFRAASAGLKPRATTSTIRSRLVTSPSHRRRRSITRYFYACGGRADRTGFHTSTAGGTMVSYRWTATMVLVAAFSAIGYAQTDQGKFTGTVRDTTGGFVAGATVTVKNERTGEERMQTTFGTGVFLIANLKPSTYTVRATKDGFAAVEYSQLPIAVGQELHLDLEV